MPKRRQRPRKPISRRPEQGGGRPSKSSDEPEFLRTVAAAMRDPAPLALLGLVSSILTLIEPKAFALGLLGEPPAANADLMESFLDARLVETSALLAGIEALTTDELLRQRIRRELASRRHPLPVWLTGLDRAVAIEPAIEFLEPLRDGDDVLVGVEFAGGAVLTAIVLIEHNLGSLVKDAFVVPGSPVELAGRLAELAQDVDVEARDLPGVDARARITAAIERAAMTVPPFEGENWPASRPLLEWMIRLLPPGGVGYERPEWSVQDKAELTVRFLASPFAADLDEVHWDLLSSVLWFGTDYGPGDPMRWSPLAVEILLLDWIPRRILDSADRLAKAPELLRAFVRFCHDERGIRAGLTEETIAAIRVMEPEYQRLIRSPRLQGPAALLASIGLLDAEFEDDLDEDYGLDHSEIMLKMLSRAVGGDAALDALDSEPLPDEPFDWQAIPADLHDRVREVVDLTDRCCDEMLGVEVRTACRRVLAEVAAGDPAIFRRRARAETAAAAICWMVGAANSLFEAVPGSRAMLLKDLMARFGNRDYSPRQRAEPMLRAIGVDPHRHREELSLGSPRYLTSARRAQIRSDRDRFRRLASSP